MKSIAFTSLLAATFAAAANCQGGNSTFQLTREYSGDTFFDGFNFRSQAYYINQGTKSGDPTDGSVNYQNRSAAFAQGLVNTNNGQAYIGADHTNIAKARTPGSKLHGRNSVRIESKESFSSGILIADIAHQPGTACGVWPSYWSYDFEDNSQGEIDVIEGINLQQRNIVSLHTCGNCEFKNIGPSNPRSNCNIGGSVSKQCLNGKNFDGCGNTMSNGSYGNPFNAIGGGVYVTYLEQDFVKLYWFPRSSIPADITAGNPDPSNWGTPASTFTSGSNCDVSKYYKNQTIILNIDFCGASIPQSVWNDSCKMSTGVSTCDSYVANQPSAFKETYWLINSIKLYQ